MTGKSISSDPLYRTLSSTESIRLLRLQPGAGNDAINTSLELILDYAKSPPYQALSYCWGDANSTLDLVCSGQTIQITSNLHEALIHLRRQDESCLIWCDAVCIDQNNVPERNQQVSIMGKIYQRASRVCVWLGAGGEDTKDTLKILLEIARRIHDHNARGSPFKAWLSQLSVREDKYSIITHAYPMDEDAFSSEQWKLLGRFYNAEWFRRIWVIQEIQAASEGWVICGLYEIEWDIVALAASWISAQVPWRSGVNWKVKYFGSYLGFRGAQFMWAQTFATLREAPFMALLQRARTFHGTDARDKVFCMLHHRMSRPDTGLHPLSVSENGKNPTPSSLFCQGLKLPIDYKTSTLEVYRQVVMQSLQTYNNAEALCYAAYTSCHDLSWPSWIPRWNIALQESEKTTVIPFLYNASQRSRFAFRLSHNQNVLSLQGIKLGTIVTTSTSLEYTAFGTQDSSSSETGVETQLRAISKILTHDRWQEAPFVETNATRSHDNDEALFAGFSAYILPLLKDHGEACHISLMVGICCDCCGKWLHPLRGKASTIPSEFFRCHICESGPEDICLACYNTGRRCGDPSHIMKRRTVRNILIQHTDAVFDILKRHAPNGDGERYKNLLSVTNARLVYFEGSQGWYGSASEAIEPGDVLTVLFGSRVPVILREHGSGYRLVSIGYVQGLMDGEAMDMLNSGELLSETFDIS
ncbi:HET-domain-containing protein [Tothia fuscella]|uniref:HET-domain-containing protein n=1 Tax=Tothia fuscella TaxID=1048955 RepID=A0A9P4NQ97_9PEZI|nr:HET-domain-containing protein [Tothia fuscella]